LLALLLIGLFLVVVVTYGLLCQIFIYVAAGLFSLCVLLFLIGMLATRGGHEILGEAATEGCLEALLGGLFAEQAIARIAHKENPDLKEEPDWTFKLAPAPLRVRDRELLFLLLA
jgi:Flp pilus assembly protein TadB